MNKRKNTPMPSLPNQFLQEIAFFLPQEKHSLFRDNIILSANLFSFNGKSLLNLGLRFMK